MKQKIKIAIIGSGFMAKAHADAFASIEDVSLVGIHSRSIQNSSHMAALYSIDTVCHSIADLYHLTRADILVIAVSELETIKVCAEAFKYPWVCLIEKPVGINYEQAVGILKIPGADKAYVALNRRHYSSTRAVLADVQRFSDSRLVTVFDQESPSLATKAGVPSMVVENWMYANSIHLVDYFSIFCRGKLDGVDPIVKWSPNNPKFVVSRLTFDSGDIGIYSAAWNCPGPWGVTIATHERFWEMRPLEEANYINFGSRTKNAVPVDHIDSEYKTGLRYQAEQVIRVVKGLPNTLPTLRDAFKTVDLIRQIYVI